MTEPTSGVPVWARKRRGKSNPLVGLVLVPLALLGALTGSLAIRDRSFAAAGVRMDVWLVVGRARVQQMIAGAASKPVTKRDELAG